MIMVQENMMMEKYRRGADVDITGRVRCYVMKLDNNGKQKY